MKCDWLTFGDASVIVFHAETGSIHIYTQKSFDSKWTPRIPHGMLFQPILEPHHPIMHHDHRSRRLLYEEHSLHRQDSNEKEHAPARKPRVAMNVRAKGRWWSLRVTTIIINCQQHVFFSFSCLLCYCHDDETNRFPVLTKGGV